MSDLIKRENVLDGYCNQCDRWDCNIETCYNAKWIRNIPSVMLCDDSVSRKAVEYLLAFYVDEDKYTKAVIDLRKLPPIAPKQKKGYWINTNPEYKNGFYNNSYYCSECKDYYTTSPKEMHFCPNCGSKMEIIKEN